QYEHRKRYLKRKLTPLPNAGLVTRFTKPANLVNADVDVLTAIQVLKGKHGQDLPAGFLALEKSLALVPTPLSPTLHRHQSLREDEGKSDKPARDQTKGNKQKADDKLLLAILGLAVVHHDLQLGDRSDIKRVAKNIAEEFKEAGLGGAFGLGVDGVETMLKTAVAVAEDKKVFGL
ncbi:MAG: hypothetical protein Q7T55_22300, partial [Solirubrobacteraceae bacterium]|nr:hypothetical protein [Solirubrobacteraceae bacterium]